MKKNKLDEVINEGNEINRLDKVSFKQELVDNNIILDVHHLKQYFKLPGNVKLKAVHDVSFHVKKGECFGIVGESGCGKTTTGRTIMRLYNATSGSVYFKGHRISAGTRWNDKEMKFSKIRAQKKINELKSDKKEAILKAKAKYSNEELPKQLKKIREKFDGQIFAVKEELEKVFSVEQHNVSRAKYDNSHVDHNLLTQIQMIFQDPIESLDPRMTVKDIIAEGLKISKKYNQKEINEMVYNVLDTVGLVREHANRYPHEFSGGQRQRIGIARAIVMNPELIIADEPVSALDVSVQAQVINLLNDLKEKMDLSIVFIAHDLSVVKYFCDRIAVMYFGEIVEEASSDELFRHPLHPYTKSLLSAIPQADPISEKTRVRIDYNPSMHDYSEDEASRREILPNHFINCNQKEFEQYKKEIEALDKQAN